MAAGTVPGARGGFGRAVLPVWLAAAAWDAVCATALSVFGYGTAPGAVWQGVAATATGSSTLSAGAQGVALGLVIHSIVALTWSAIFVAAVRAWPSLGRAILTRAGAFAVAAIYGPAIWLVMSLVVIPLATGRPPRFGMRWWIQVGAHVPFVSLPLVFTGRHLLRRGGFSDDESPVRA